MPPKPRKSKLPAMRVERHDAILAEVVGLLEAARHGAARAVNTVMTATYWQIGRRIVEAEQGGTVRAEYGERLLKCASVCLDSALTLTLSQGERASGRAVPRAGWRPGSLGPLSPWERVGERAASVRVRP